MKETEIAEQVVDWLEEQHWEVYQEVTVSGHSGVADIVAVQNGLVWVIECKRTMSLSVLAQAEYWRVHFRSVAVPAPKSNIAYGRRLGYRIAKDYLKIGVINVDVHHLMEVSQPVPAPLMREYHKFAVRFRSMLVEQHKTYAKAGAQHGKHWTPYKSTILACQRYVADHPGCTMKEMIDGIGKQHYANDKSAISNLRINFQTFEKHRFRVDESQRPFRIYLRKESK